MLERSKKVCCSGPVAWGKHKAFGQKHLMSYCMGGSCLFVGVFKGLPAFWGYLERQAADRDQWRALVEALCAAKHEED